MNTYFIIATEEFAHLIRVSDTALVSEAIAAYFDAEFDRQTHGLPRPSGWTTTGHVLCTNHTNRATALNSNASFWLQIEKHQYDLDVDDECFVLTLHTTQAWEAMQCVQPESRAPAVLLPTLDELWNMVKPNERGEWGFLDKDHTRKLMHVLNIEQMQQYTSNGTFNKPFYKVNGTNNAYVLLPGRLSTWTGLFEDYADSGLPKEWVFPLSCVSYDFCGVLLRNIPENFEETLKTLKQETPKNPRAPHKHLVTRHVLAEFLKQNPAVKTWIMVDEDRQASWNAYLSEEEEVIINKRPEALPTHVWKSSKRSLEDTKDEEEEEDPYADSKRFKEDEWKPVSPVTGEPIEQLAF